MWKEWPYSEILFPAPVATTAITDILTYRWSSLPMGSMLPTVQVTVAGLQATVLLVWVLVTLLFKIIFGP